MNRQKKEILKKMQDIEDFIEADKQLGSGCCPVDAYDGLYEMEYKLGEQLAKLSHYSSYKEMMWDERGCR